MRVYTYVCPKAAVRRSAAGWFLEGSLGGLILAIKHTQQPLITVGDAFVEHFHVDRAEYRPNSTGTSSS